MNQNSTSIQNVQDGVQHSKPIPIATQHLHRRSSSSVSDSSNSPTSSPLVTPNYPITRIPPSSSSPILYFLSQSPSKTSSTFPFRGFPPPPLPEDETIEEHPPAHVRRGSISTMGRFQPPPTVPEPHHERGVNVLRRLSLGGHAAKPPVTDIPQPNNPQPPPNSAASESPTTNNIPSHRKFRRSATVTGQTRPRRAPSPMGERILKGHFDGFN